MFKVLNTDLPSASPTHFSGRENENENIVGEGNGCALKSLKKRSTAKQSSLSLWLIPWVTTDRQAVKQNFRLEPIRCKGRANMQMTSGELRMWFVLDGEGSGGGGTWTK